MVSAPAIPALLCQRVPYPPDNAGHVEAADRPKRGLFPLLDVAVRIAEAGDLDPLQTFFFEELQHSRTETSLEGIFLQGKEPPRLGDHGNNQLPVERLNEASVHHRQLDPFGS